MALELCRASLGERRRHLPGDEFVPQPMGSITHAITINAPPDVVWPWLVQLGSGRAGWYAYDHIDNGGTPSARRIIPELQHVAVGDVMPWLPGARDGFIVRDVLPERALVLGVPLQAASDSSFPALRASWALVLEPLDHNRTRLITRSRIARSWLAPQEDNSAAPATPIFIERIYDLLAKMPWPLVRIVAGSGHYLMESRMLRGIKRRAEQRPAEEHANTKKPRRTHGASMQATSLVKAAVALGVAGLAYVKLVRPWYRHWGAAAEEVARAMPLDNWILNPTIVTTRAITIHARPEQIWPWIVQMGEPPRAGYYSYTWIERLQGLEIENADRLLPEFQTLNVGDSLDKAGNMTVLDVEPGHYLVLGPPGVYDWLKSTWVIALYPIDEHATRLVTRLRARMNVLGMLRALPPTVWPFWLLIDPGVFIMERKMMTAIKRHAEHMATDAAHVHAARPVNSVSVNPHEHITQDGGVFARWRRWMYQGKRPNWLARQLIRVDVALAALGLTGKAVVTLEVVGRMSGRVITLPLVVAIVEGQRYLVSMLGTDAQWVRNVRAANGRAALRNGGRREVRLEEVPVEQRAPILKAYLRRAPGARPHIPVDKDAPLAAFEPIAAAYPVFRVAPREEA